MSSERQDQDSHDSETPSVLSEIFCAPDADVTFESSDGIRFAIHRKNLETHAGGLSPEGFEILDEIVHLTEDSATLGLLFQFVYPQRPPDVNSMDFNVVLPLAEAAEKYEVFAAMYICSNRLRAFLPNHALEIISFAGKHDYPDMIGIVAPLMFDEPLAEIVSVLPSRYLKGWVLYQEQWHDVRRHAARSQQNPLKVSFTCHSHQREASLLVDYLGDLASFKDLRNKFNGNVLSSCERFRGALNVWVDDIEREISKIQKYIDLL